MKHLTLIRHAKSSYDAPVDDIDRPLNERGLSDAPAMGARLRELGATFDALYCSQGRRAHQTADLIAGELGLADLTVQPDLLLYTFNDIMLLDYIENLDDSLSRVVLVAHNPATSDVAERLTGADIGDVPTCAVICMDLSIDSWEEVTDGCGALVHYDFPKNRL